MKTIHYRVMENICITDCPFNQKTINGLSYARVGSRNCINCEFFISRDADLLEVQCGNKIKIGEMQC